ncbi:MAG: hypothetical protein MUF51_05565 [Vicinamibacteria bacterium]|nr:hypothetical protein [Vicinamibacteria bacterium]
MLPEPANPKPIEKPHAPSPLVWVGSTYFAEGLPLMIVRKLATVFFTDIGVDLKTIGQLNFLGYLWNVKFLWAAFLDVIGTKRRWLIAMQFLIGLLTLGIAALAYSLPRFTQGSGLGTLVIVVALILVVMATLSATNDIAIDGYYMEGIRDSRVQAAYSGHRVLAYRIAIIYVNFGLVILASLFARKELGWALSFGAAGVTMLLLSIGHHFFLPKVEIEKATTDTKRIFTGFIHAFSEYLRQTRIVLVLLFIVTYKADEMLFAMNTPFLMRDLMLSKGQLSWLAGLVGAGATIIGAMAASWWIKRVGFRNAIWPITLLMNLSIWAYIWLAWTLPSAKTREGLIVIACVTGYEHLVAGLGNTALIIFLLRTCKPEFKAAHFAFGTALMSIPANLIGGFAGSIIGHIGWIGFFCLAYVVSAPAMLLIPWIPYKDDPQAV